MRSETRDLLLHLPVRCITVAAVPGALLAAGVDHRWVIAAGIAIWLAVIVSMWIVSLAFADVVSDFGFRSGYFYSMGLAPEECYRRGERRRFVRDWQRLLAALGVVAVGGLSRLWLGG